jgi:putative restriction endonuclease
MSLDKRIANLLTWKKGDKRAPHKPLLLLLAIGNIQRGGKRLQYFEEIEPTLTRALELFGPSGRVATPQYPFWRLQHDDLWVVESDGVMVLRKSSDDPTKRALIEKRARAGFMTDHFDALRSDKLMQSQVIHQLLDAHFPSSIHEDIIAFFDLEIAVPGSKDNEPSGTWRHRVLRAYGWKCAVTQFSVGFQRAIFGVEPSSIRWPQAGGSSAVNNAVALTTLHRKLFQLGIFTIDTKYRIRVSRRASDECLPAGMLTQFEGARIGLPSSQADHPDKACLEWHASEVFRG